MKTTIVLLLSLAGGLCASRGDERLYQAPKIWDESKLKDWALPLANGGPELRHVSEQDYYASPVENLRSYPVYHPDREPPGYMEKLRNMEPQPLMEIGKPRTKVQWIETGAQVFLELNQPVSRTDDPELLAFVRDREALKKSGAQLDKDGAIYGMRWVIEKRGRLRISDNQCHACHTQIRSDGNDILAGPGNVELLQPARTRAINRGTSGQFGLPTDPVSPQRLALARFSVPWIEDDKHAILGRMSGDELRELTQRFPGTFLRTQGSPFWMTKIPDLRNIGHQKFVDATATHRMREPADIGRYAALVMLNAYSGDYGKHRFKPEGWKPSYHFPDDVLYALAEYLWSLEPLPNPNMKNLSPVEIARGQEIFKQENCAKCHSGPNYGGEKLTLAKGYTVPKGHPAEPFIIERSVGTDPGLALKTRKGTGFYKVPSLRGLWYRQLFGHSGWVNSLEDWFDPRRLESDFKLTGWVGPEGSPRQVPGHTYGTDLSAEDRKALITYLRTL